MQENIQVSVVIPIHNAGKWLMRCLETLSKQTLRSMEFICVLDCPTDGSDSMVETYAQKDSRFVVIKNDRNLGVSESRNVGIRWSKGEYIGFSDHDDWRELSMYETLYKKAIETNADVVVSDTFVEYADRQELVVVPKNLSNEQYIDSILYPVESPKCMFKLARSVWHSIYKKAFLEDHHIIFYDRDKYLEEDTLFNLQFYTKKYTVAYVDEAFYHWNLNRVKNDNYSPTLKTYNTYTNQVNLIVGNRYKQAVEESFSLTFYRNMKKYQSEDVTTICGENVRLLSLKSVKKALGKTNWRAQLRNNYIYILKFIFWINKIKK